MVFRLLTLTWRQCIILWLLNSGLSTYTLVFSDGDPHCSSTFQVWTPGQDAQKMIRELYLKMDNVTSYSKYQIAEIRAHLAAEISRINNWTFAVDKRVFEMQISRMDEELLQMKYATGSSKIQSEVQHTTRRVDDLEKIVFGIRSKLRNVGVSTAVNSKTHHLRDTLQRQEGVSETLSETLQNRIGDLTAEWVLLKRDVVGLEKEDKRHRRQIQIFINETVSLKSAVDYVSSVNKDLQEKNLELTIQQSEIKERMDEIASAAEDIHNTLDDFKTQNKEEILTELQASTGKLQNEIDALTTRLDQNKINDPSSDHDVNKPNAVLRQSDSRSQSEDIRHVAFNKDAGGFSTQPSAIQVFKDCHDVYRAGYHISSMYDVFPDGIKYRVPVYCYMANGTGHTLIQRRVDGTINFNRRWMEYQQGFGNPFGEVWAGNELIHSLTKQKRYVLRVDLWDWEGEQFYAEYTKFWVDGEDEHYRIHVGGYSGNAGDSLSYHDKMAFSTEDMDNDLHPRNCAAENKGGWWYNSCFYSHLNGLYHTGWYAHTQSKYADGVAWFTLKDNEFYSVKKVEMTIKPLRM